MEVVISSRSGKSRQTRWTPTAARKEEILDCAEKLFAARGYRSTTLIDIAEEIGIAKATVFHHYRTKEQILFELYTRAMDLALTRLAAVDDEVGEPERVLNAMLREHALVILHNRELFTIFFGEEDGLMPDHLAQISAQRRQYFGSLIGPIEQLAAAGRLRVSGPSWVIARTLLGAGSWTHRWVDPERGMSDDEISESIARVMLHGLVGS